MVNKPKEGSRSPAHRLTGSPAVSEAITGSPAVGEGIRVKPRDVMPQHAFTLPAEYYVSREYFDREMNHLFARMWVCAGRTEQVDVAGRFFVREFLGERIIITRGQTAVNAFYNVCRHRGTELCTAKAGSFGTSIQCPYHAWTYDFDGRLIGAPHMDEVPHFRKED